MNESIIQLEAQADWEFKTNPDANISKLDKGMQNTDEAAGPMNARQETQQTPLQSQIFTR